MHALNSQNPSWLQESTTSLAANITIKMRLGFALDMRDVIDDRLRAGCYQSPLEVYLSAGLTSLTYNTLRLEHQVKHGPYAIDLVASFIPSQGPKYAVAIECDGHAFHERTKQQVARDKKRDRVISGAYGRVLRFSGSEVYNDLYEVLSEIILAASELQIERGPL